MEIVDMGKSPKEEGITLNKDGTLTGKGRCPNCGWKIERHDLKPDRRSYSWCKHCGQRIIWMRDDNA